MNAPIDALPAPERARSYSQLADFALKVAAQTADPVLKAGYLDIATEWLEVASVADARPVQSV